jgi:hypothetical protein
MIEKMWIITEMSQRSSQDRGALDWDLRILAAFAAYLAVQCRKTVIIADEYCL